MENLSDLSNFWKALVLINIIANVYIIGYGTYVLWELQKRKRERQKQNEELRKKISEAIQRKFSQEPPSPNAPKVDEYGNPQTSYPPNKHYRPNFSVINKDELREKMTHDPSSVLDEFGLDQFIEFCRIQSVDDLYEVKARLEEDNYFEVCPYIVDIIDEKISNEN